MGRLRYSINVTLDGCCDHLAVPANEELHRHSAGALARADALLFGRITYEMMESAWRPSPDGQWPTWMDDWMQPFAQTIDTAEKYVVSSTLEHVDWNAELVDTDPAMLDEAVRRLKDRHRGELLTGGVQLPFALAQLGLIDEYEIIVHPRIAGHGPHLFAGLAQPVALQLVDRQQFETGAAVLRYVPAN